MISLTAKKNSNFLDLFSLVFRYIVVQAAQRQVNADDGQTGGDGSGHQSRTVAEDHQQENGSHEQHRRQDRNQRQGFPGRGRGNVFNFI